MRLRPAAILLLALTACPASRVPPHLQPPDPTPDDTAAPSFTNLDGLLLAMIGRDPLGRSPKGIDADAAEKVQGGAPYAQLLRASERLGPDQDEALREIRDLEAQHRGTPVVAFARGIRLREIEATAGATSAINDAAETRISSLLTPLSATEKSDGLPRRPMAWLSAEQGLQQALLIAGDRWALLGWLDGPGVDLQPVADALGTAPYDSLRTTPAAQLVLARASGADEESQPGLEDLDRASRELLREAVLDDKRSRERSAATWKAIGEELQSDNPRDALLARAESRLRDAARKDEAAGGALLALQARRIWGACPNPPCTGVDRVDGLAAAARWNPRVAVYSRRMQLAALHEAIDGIEVARGTVRYPQAALALVDALIGTGAVPPDALVLRQRSPDASTWLTLGRSVGVEPCTTWEETQRALRAWASARAEEALNEEEDDAVRAALDRIRKQGAP